MANHPAPRTIASCLSWLVHFAKVAISDPNRCLDRYVVVLAEIGELLNAEAQKEVPAYETMFATALTCALLKHTAVTQGTDNAFRVQVLIAALLPLVRVDLARAIEFEFKQEGERA